MTQAITDVRTLKFQVSYNHDVRRLLAISLLLLFSVTLISPLFALSTNAGGNLPACCRRNGTHHCALMMSGEQSRGIQFSAVPQRCPAYPKAVTPNRRNDLSLMTSTDRSIEIVIHAAGKAEAIANARIEHYWFQQERGPPVLLA